VLERIGVRKGGVKKKVEGQKKGKGSSKRGDFPEREGWIE